MSVFSARNSSCWLALPFWGGMGEAAISTEISRCKNLGTISKDFSASHAPIKVNPSMNALRRVMSEM